MAGILSKSEGGRIYLDKFIVTKIISTRFIVRTTGIPRPEGFGVFNYQTNMSDIIIEVSGKISYHFLVLK